MMCKLLLVATMAMVTHAARAAPPTDADRAALQTLAAELDVAWDHGDPEAVSAFYAGDGTLRLDNRPLVEGRSAVQRYFEETIGRRPVGARHVTRVEHIDMVTPDLALVDAHARIERDGAQGERQVLADFHNQTLAVRVGSTWRLRVVRAQRMATPVQATAAQQSGAAR
jgi:uncharacterized protein (TIGR02246 family)